LRGNKYTNHHQAEQPHKFLHFVCLPRLVDVRDSRQNTRHPRTRSRRVQSARRSFSSAIIRSANQRFNSAKEVVPKNFQCKSGSDRPRDL
jgi:hypothetical protein